MRSYHNSWSHDRQHSSPRRREDFEHVGEILGRVWPKILARLDLPPGGPVPAISPGTQTNRTVAGEARDVCHADSGGLRPTVAPSPPAQLSALPVPHLSANQREGTTGMVLEAEYVSRSREPGLIPLARIRDE